MEEKLKKQGRVKMDEQKWDKKGMIGLGIWFSVCHNIPYITFSWISQGYRFFQVIM